MGGVPLAPGGTLSRCPFGHTGPPVPFSRVSPTQGGGTLSLHPLLCPLSHPRGWSSAGVPGVQFGESGGGLALGSAAALDPRGSRRGQAGAAPRSEGGRDRGMENNEHRSRGTPASPPSPGPSGRAAEGRPRPRRRSGRGQGRGGDGGPAGSAPWPRLGGARPPLAAPPPRQPELGRSRREPGGAAEPGERSGARRGCGRRRAAEEPAPRRAEHSPLPFASSPAHLGSTWPPWELLRFFYCSSLGFFFFLIFDILIFFFFFAHVEERVDFLP